MLNCDYVFLDSEISNYFALPLLAKELSEKRAKTKTNATKNQSFFIVVPA